MNRAEKFIEENTRNCSQLHYNSACTLRHCITPDHARKVAEIAREETINEVCEWLDNHTMLSEKWYIEDLKKHLDSKL